MLGAVRHTEHGEPLRWPTGLVSLPGRCVGSPSVGYTRYDAAAVLNEALLPLNPAGNRRAGGPSLFVRPLRLAVSVHSS